MHLEQIKILSDKIDTFTSKYIDTQLSVSGQKEIQRLLEKDIFKVVTLNKVVMSEEIPSSLQVFDSCFVNDIKDLYTDKAYEKSCPVMHAYNDKKKNLMLMHFPKKLEVRQSISFCLTTIIGNNDNNNIKIYLQDIMQAYIKIASDLNPNVYIQSLSKLILRLCASFDSIVKVMRPLYGKLEVDNYRFDIYHLHYKEKLGITEFGIGSHNLNK